MMTAIQQAVFAALSADAPLMSMVAGIHDDREQAGDPADDANFPFVLIGDDIASPWSTDDWSGGEVLVRINAYSRYAGYGEVKQIADRVRAVLDRVPLTVVGYDAVDIGFDGSNFARDPDGKTRNATITFRLLIN